ncbi:hypothetical protein SKAU_G00270310 [Synaphobranchus kaupii]|uniref:Uncharacterized protein n=1 Tax=Synaphobranchus kaupii TaxID=118154 RepID=A0A9Q1F047_SYNKA|nr:hypothetical protein SKAU_G00270310 [Synaphobranchus kaupii]
MCPSKSTRWKGFQGKPTLKTGRRAIEFPLPLHTSCTAAGTAGVILPATSFRSTAALINALFVPAAEGFLHREERTGSFNNVSPFYAVKHRLRHLLPRPGITLQGRRRRIKTEEDVPAAQN